jgi:molecular chaperone HscB
MQADFSQNHFELFGLPVGFDVDRETLSLRYRDLQRAVHPDRFANASEHERRLSVQRAAQINEAFRTLKQPLARARYLLELKGRPLDETDTAMDPSFLMEQMELRERIEAIRSAADPFQALAVVRTQLEEGERFLVTELGTFFADGGEHALEQARQAVRKLQFFQKLLEEVAELEEDLVHQG